MAQIIDRQAEFSGTKAPSQALAFDVAALETHLSARIPDFAGPLTVEQFKGGQSNPTYKLITPGETYVLRRKPPGKLLPSAHAVDREFRVISALSGAGFPVARPYLYEADESVIGTAFYVMGFCDGRILWEPALPASDKAERGAIYKAMVTTLARLHSFDPQAIGLSDFGKGENYVARQVDRWTKQYRLSETKVVASMDRLIDWLPGNLPPPGPVRLVHGDYRLDNMVLYPDRPEVMAVLDWELATLGDPLADATYHFLTWVMPIARDGTGTGSLIGRDLADLGIPDLETYAGHYADLTGMDPRPYLNTYMAYNFFRLAAILQGIVGRVRDGTASNSAAALMADQVTPLADAGWEFALKAGAKL